MPQADRRLRALERLLETADRPDVTWHDGESLLLLLGAVSRRPRPRQPSEPEGAMKTQISVLQGSACDMTAIATQSVDQIVTSPPYPMVEMWDDVFAAQDPRIRAHLDAGEGRDAFELMHRILDVAWLECDRVLRPGGIACVNIGDATRTLRGDFQLYPNHWRILSAFLGRGYASLPDILWRKPTNAPNKFMGSGMLPVGAYVTYEHEYVLVLRKGRRRGFALEEEKALRRQSAFFWEERNIWFSDVWYDIKGTPQALVERSARDRSAAFPFELAYRLVSMFSIKQDVVLDPFAGTGTTLVAALALGRSALGVELDDALAQGARSALAAAPALANRYTRERLTRHVQFAAERTHQGRSPKHVNQHYRFPVVTGQETGILIGDVLRTAAAGADSLSVEHADTPQADMVCLWEDMGPRPSAPSPGDGRRDTRERRRAPGPEQPQLRFGIGERAE